MRVRGRVWLRVCACVHVGAGECDCGHVDECDCPRMCMRACGV